MKRETAGRGDEKGVGNFQRSSEEVRQNISYNTEG